MALSKKLNPYFALGVLGGVAAGVASLHAQATLTQSTKVAEMQSMHERAVTSLTSQLKAVTAQGRNDAATAKAVMCMNPGTEVLQQPKGVMATIGSKFCYARNDGTLVSPGISVHLK